MRKLNANLPSFGPTPRSMPWRARVLAICPRKRSRHRDFERRLCGSLLPSASPSAFVCDSLVVSDTTSVLHGSCVCATLVFRRRSCARARPPYVIALQCNMVGNRSPPVCIQWAGPCAPKSHTRRARLNMLSCLSYRLPCDFGKSCLANGP